MPAVRNALVVYGGWDGHTPKQSVDRFIPFLQQHGFAVTVSNDLASYADTGLMASQDLIVQCVTMAKISPEQWKGLNEAVRGGCGLAGWHGGLCDSFREHTEYQFMTGGQWVAHPGNRIAYDVHISNPFDEVTAGLADFRMPCTEQYYLHTDPGNTVLATTRFSGEHAAETRDVAMPVVWKKRWGQGRVFFNALGHTFADFDVAECRLLTERGLLWAARPNS
jgi:type 1 glutamine amidotransferase